MEERPTRNPLKRLYRWVLRWAEHPAGAWALFAIAIIESSIFPIPPDVLLMALCLGRPMKAWAYAANCTAGSVLGGLAGYGIGWGLWELGARDLFIPHVFSQEAFDKVAALYQEHAAVAVFTAALTPIPYKVFTISGGVTGIALLPFVGASIVGRGLRFFAVAALLYFFGDRAKRFIDRWFEVLTILFVALLVLGFLLLKKVL